MRNVKEKKERALGVKLFLKAERCNSPKCAFVRKPYPPGMHGQSKRKKAFSDYAKQLREKKKMQIIYGLKDKQMSNLFKKYSSNDIISLLERRLDAVVFNIGFAPSIRMARQLVSHGHILVNGKVSKIPSRVVSKKDVVSIRKESMSKNVFSGLQEKLKQIEPPSWIKLDKNKLEAEIISDPDVENRNYQFDISLIAEFYSR